MNRDQAMAGKIFNVGAGVAPCMVCSAPMTYFMSKTFNSWGLTSLDYVKCVDCGFVACSTLLNLPDAEWVQLNNWFHTEIYKNPGDPYNRAGRLTGQARVVNVMLEYGLLSDVRPMLDWGSGVGDLAKKMAELDRKIFSYDKYIIPQVNKWPGSEPEKRFYSLVTATAVFEHLKTRAELDAIESLVALDGVLAFHIAVPKQIPSDPSWVYFLPVHCAFHNWESLRRLMIQWGYRSSVYCHEALMWFFFRTEEGVQEAVARINGAMGYRYLLCSNGFVSSTAVELPLNQDGQDSSVRGLYIGSRHPDLGPSWVVGQVDFETGAIILPGQPELLDEGSFDLIYSDLISERMEPKQFTVYLGVVLRLLKSHGVHRIVTADLDRTLGNADKGSWKDFQWVKQAGVSTRGEYLNLAMRSWGHKWIYDAESLMKGLHAAGYRNIWQVEMNTSRAMSPRIPEADGHRLYIEAAR
jgi:predicted SAM-dependent methyltransferase